MFRRLFCLCAGAMALMAVLGAPGQLHAAQMMRGGGARMAHPGMMRGGGARMAHPGMMRGGGARMVHPGMRGRGRFDPRFNRGSFRTPGMNRLFLDPRIGPTVGPMFFRPF